MAPDLALAELYGWLAKTLGFIPMFTLYLDSPILEIGRSLFTGGIVLVAMILPVIVAITREAFAQTPQGHIEASFVLGAIRWEMVKLATLPFGRLSFTSGSTLGLRCALGETMMLYLIIPSSSAFHGSLLDDGIVFVTVITNVASESNNNPKAGVYISTGLVLFLLTFVANSAARLTTKK